MRRVFFTLVCFKRRQYSKPAHRPLSISPGEVLPPSCRVGAPVSYKLYKQSSLQ